MRTNLHEPINFYSSVMVNPEVLIPTTNFQNQRRAQLMLQIVRGLSTWGLSNPSQGSPKPWGNTGLYIMMHKLSNITAMKYQQNNFIIRDQYT